MKRLIVKTCGYLYRLAVRPLLFLADSEKVHGQLTAVGEYLGKTKFLKSILRRLWRTEDPALRETLHGITFASPVGLAAGFDYEARLVGILPALGFGFETIGTITNKPYEGNSSPRLGRLVKSRSLLVNKGFKNLGIYQTLRKLAPDQFEIPVGLSIGKTNALMPMTQEEAVFDVVSVFKSAESSHVPFNYYELNISCPNLYGDVEFYTLGHLNGLLARVTELKLSKPLFIKMPIEKSDKETMDMLDAIISYPVQGVIIGNLQKNRLDPSLDQNEVRQYAKGYFSGKPTEKRSNELIRLAYKNYGDKLTIIGCGGVFSPEDAYAKIKLGASLIQLITGLIYVGPQLPAQINLGLAKLLQRDGFSHISQAIGIDAK